MADRRFSTQLELDLFAAVMPPAQQRQVDALTCLRDSMSDALEVVANLRYNQPDDSRAPRLSGNWAFCVSRPGLRFENADEWWSGGGRRRESRGWNRTPANLVTWDELRTWIGHDPRRAEISAWTESLPAPRWKLLMRPHELWPDPEGWHTGYFCRDHVHEQWPARRRAWGLTLTLLNDAIDQVSP